MNANLMRVTLALALMTASGLSHATPPGFTIKWSVQNVLGVGTGRSIPVSCDPFSAAATNTWNAVGANFQYNFNSTNYHARIAEQPQDFNYKNVTIEDGVLDAPTWVMKTTSQEYTTTTPRSLANTDIIVDKRRINQPTPLPPDAPNQIACASGAVPGSFDWQSAILHELGHAFGMFQHSTDDPTCAMYTTVYPAVLVRNLCEAEKQAFLTAYGDKFAITSIPDVTGPQFVNIPAQIFFDGAPKFPLTRQTKTIQCASGWSCDDYNGNHSSGASPLAFNFKCDPSEPLPTATFRWRTTLTDANGMVSNAVEHSSTCTKPAGKLIKTSGKSKGGNRVIVTN